MAELRVTLVDEREETDSRHVSAEINEKGNLILAGIDVGEAPLEFWGDDDYEYWLIVTADLKEKVWEVLINRLKQEGSPVPEDFCEGYYEDKKLLLLIKHVYQGSDSTFDNFRRLLTENGIQTDFLSYV